MLSASQYFSFALLPAETITFYSLLIILKLTPFRDYLMK
ncbi:putative membrane protein [Enterobacter hormaechei]|nr:putative membrane protein [Enterobacter hormaechei]